MGGLYDSKNRVAAPNRGTQQFPDKEYALFDIFS